MAFKLVTFAALVAVASAGHLTGLHAPALAYSGIHAGHGVAAYGAPALAHGYAATGLAQGYAATGLAHGYAAPVVAHGYAAPAVATYAHAAPAVVAKTVVADAPAAYDFGYSVSDPLTGDHKSQVETRRGDAVQGSYSLVDSDGTKRTVDYAADDVSGFNAVVRKEPLAVAVKTVAAPAIAAVHAAPAVATYAAAPAYAHGIAAHGYAAPALAHGYAASTLAHGYAAPALAHGYAAHGYAAPALAHGYGASTLAHGYAAPALAHGYAAPALTQAW